MKLKFTKMHGCGNDYIYFNCMEKEIENPSYVSRVLSDRHFSVGGDGIVLVCASEKADAKMRMFNADGSEGRMCGNASRCIGRYLYERVGIKKENLTLETLSGIKKIKLNIKNGRVESVSVNMGAPIISPEKIPTTFDGERVLNRQIEIDGAKYEINCVSMGNPHCVLFMDGGFDIDNFDIKAIGEKFEHAKYFPEGVNTEFVKIIGENKLQMRVWERGSGETLACGTGACATAVAAWMRGDCKADMPISVKLIGGELKIENSGDGIIMSGPAEFAFDGEVEI